MLDRSHKRKLITVLILVFLSAIFEALGLIIIYPFILSISAPDEFQVIAIQLEQYNIRFIANHILVFTVSIILISNLIKFIANFSMNNFIQNLRPYFSSVILKKLFRNEYDNLINIDRSRIQADVINEVDLLLATYYMPLLSFTASLSAVSMILISLLTLSWKITTLLFMIFGCIFLILHFVTSRYLTLIGGKRAKANDQRLKWLLVILDSMKIIKYEKIDYYFVQKFYQASQKSSNLIAKNYNIAQSPRYIIEGVSLSLFVVAIWFVNMSGDGHGGVVKIDYAVLGSLVYGGYRLLPHSNSIFQNISQFKFAKASIERVKFYIDFREPEQKGIISRNSNHSVILENVSFEYQPNNPILRNFAFEFKQAKSYAIIGQSGSGKSTLVDMILGIRQPTSGKISYPNNHKDIRDMITYAPQTVTVHEGSVMENLFIGRKLTNPEVIKTALHTAALNTIFPNSDELTKIHITDQGRNFSGGQLQRISLCRALCFPREIMIFDEVTSNLDEETEEKIVNNILKNYRSSTLIFITHSSKVSRKMDYIVDLDNHNRDVNYE